VEAALRAISNPTRRQILEVVWDSERSSSEIANRTRLSRPAASQHLRVLREAGLVAVRAEGGHRFYRTRVERLDEVREFLEGFWGTRLDALRETAETLHRSRR
jgi:DNA-binding transcriptional ArsR family regulator